MPIASKLYWQSMIYCECSGLPLVDQNVLMQAMALNWRDFEDAVQVCAAIVAGGHYIISRDTTGFAGAGLPVLSPTDMLQLLNTS